MKHSPNTKKNEARNNETVVKKNRKSLSLSSYFLDWQFVAQKIVRDFNSFLEYFPSLTAFRNVHFHTHTKEEKNRGKEIKCEWKQNSKSDTLSRKLTKRKYSFGKKGKTRKLLWKSEKFFLLGIIKKFWYFFYRNLPEETNTCGDGALFWRFS